VAFQPDGLRGAVHRIGDATLPLRRRAALSGAPGLTPAARREHEGQWRRPPLLLREGRAEASGRRHSLRTNQRPITPKTSLQVRVAAPLVVLQLSVPLPFTPLNAPVPPETVIAFLYVASVLLVNWNFPL
jgi:hypothetical protein